MKQYIMHSSPLELSLRSNGLEFHVPAPLRPVTVAPVRRRRSRGVPLYVLPPEILEIIAGYLGPLDILRLFYTSKRMNECVTGFLYDRPYLTSTYRVAQFVTTVTGNAELAGMTKTLDFSRIENGERHNAPPLAGWRDWKLLSEVHPRERPHQKRRHSGCCSTPHPLHGLSEDYSMLKDLPIGSVLQLVDCCVNLRALNLSHLPLAPDYYVLTKPSHVVTLLLDCKPKQQPLVKFVSDLPNKSHSWKIQDLQRVTSEHLMIAIARLERLCKLTIRGVPWLSRDLAMQFVQTSRAIATGIPVAIDFRDSGMVRGAPWAIKGQPCDFVLLATAAITNQ
ncbi:hypothetical protein TRVA0_008S01948 [Trichomonascus vanleenenianus]|uniref:F-box protein n=1 Tax=Trichomonascus vanleenenianus TaxID=2268995 RepID=UPI003EC99A7B